VHSVVEEGLDVSGLVKLPIRRTRCTGAAFPNPRNSVLDSPSSSVGQTPVSEGTIPSGLTLVDSKVSTIGVVIGTCEPAGEIVTGSFALD
jgi:hypothetical protein